MGNFPSELYRDSQSLDRQYSALPSSHIKSFCEERYKSVDNEHIPMIAILCIGPWDNG